jgi:hypothetical protein
MRAFLAAAGLALMTTPSFAQTLTPDAGVPLEVATRRAAAISNLRYELVLSIPDTLTSPLTGSTTIRFELKAPRLRSGQAAIT